MQINFIISKSPYNVRNFNKSKTSMDSIRCSFAEVNCSELDNSCILLLIIIYLDLNNLADECDKSLIIAEWKIAAFCRCGKDAVSINRALVLFKLLWGALVQHLSGPFSMTGVVFLHFNCCLQSISVLNVCKGPFTMFTYEHLVGSFRGAWCKWKIIANFSEPLSRFQVPFLRRKLWVNPVENYVSPIFPGFFVGNLLQTLPPFKGQNFKGPLFCIRHPYKCLWTVPNDTDKTPVVCRMS